MRPCFTFKAQAAGKPAVLAIDDEIGFWGVQARDFRDGLEAVAGDELTVEINSPGGDVFAGLGMYNMLRTFAASGKKLTTRVTGVAASMASVVVLAGDTREMPSNTFAMVHAVSGGAWGTAEDMRDTADTLDKIGTALRDIYVDRMGITAEKAVEIMSKDTWLTADECKEMGFATALVDPVTATASFNMARADLPANVKAVFEAKQTPAAAAQTPEPEVPVGPVAEVEGEIEAPVADQVLALAKTAGLEAYGPTIALFSANLADAKQRLAKAGEINALCKITNMADLAQGFVAKNNSVEEVRAALVQAKVAADKDIDGTKRNAPADTTTASSGVSTQAIWDSHHAQSKKEGR